MIPSDNKNFNDMDYSKNIYRMSMEETAAKVRFMLPLIHMIKMDAMMMNTK
jgi:hypothetical protein